MLRSKMSSWSRVACNRYSRESGRSGASRKASSRAYSPFARANRPSLRIDEAPAATIKPPSAELVSAPLDVAGAQGRSAPTAPQHGAEPGIQFADTERLGDVV